MSGVYTVPYWHVLQTACGTLRGWIDEPQDSSLAKVSYDLDSPSETWAGARTPGIYDVDTDCNREGAPGARNYNCNFLNRQAASWFRVPNMVKTTGLPVAQCVVTPESCSWKLSLQSC